MAEFYQMQKQTRYDRTLNPSYWQMFKRPSYRKRVILTVGYCILGQSTALLGEYIGTNGLIPVRELTPSVINVYGPILYGSFGYDTEQQLTLQAGWVTVRILGNLTGQSSHLTRETIKHTDQFLLHRRCRLGQDWTKTSHDLWYWRLFGVFDHLRSSVGRVC